MIYLLYAFLPTCRSLAKQEIAPPSHVVERYIDLLCHYQPEAVDSFLRANDNYRVEEALEVSAHNSAIVSDAVMCILTYMYMYVHTHKYTQYGLNLY